PPSSVLVNGQRQLAAIGRAAGRAFVRLVLVRTPRDLRRSPSLSTLCRRSEGLLIPPTLMQRVPFNVPTLVGRELEFIGAAVDAMQLSGNGGFGRRCEA